MDLIAFCNNLSNEIGFAKTPAIQIIDNYAAECGVAFRSFLSFYRNLIGGHADITRGKIFEGLWSRLKDDEKNRIADFFYGLGRHGIAEEKNKIDGAVGRFNEYKNTALEYLQTKASITLKILIIIGIAVVILLL